MDMRWLSTISYSTSASGIIVFIKNDLKISRILPNFIVRTTDFQLVFNFEQMRTVTIFRGPDIMVHDG